MPANKLSAQKILIYAGMIFLIIFNLLPLLYMLLISFSKRADFLGSDLDWQFSFESYLELFSNPSYHLWEYIANSLWVSLMTALLCVVIALLAAYAASRIDFKGKMFLMIIVLSVSMFPQLSLAGYLYKLMSSLGWINTSQALILPYTAWILPITFWILTSYLDQIPAELDEVAMLDGSSRLQTLFRILLPLAMPGIASTAIIAFVFAFNEFLFALILTTDYQARTIPVGIAFFQGLYGQTPWATIMAAATVTSIPVIIIVMFFQKKIIEGLTRGSVK